MRTITIVTLFCLFQLAHAGENAERVGGFVAAFNQQDIDAMLELAATDLRWMSVSGDQVAVETSTHAELRTAMESYFETTPGARADIRSISESGPFVHTVEQAFWLLQGAEKSQCSMAVYELADHRIQNVWYFPGYPCP